jgi:hypothetical protein
MLAGQKETRMIQIWREQLALIYKRHHGREQLAYSLPLLVSSIRQWHNCVYCIVIINNTGALRVDAKIANYLYSRSPSLDEYPLQADRKESPYHLRGCD